MRNKTILAPEGEGGGEDYWAGGRLNFGGVQGIVTKFTGEYTPPEFPTLDVPFDFKIGGEMNG